MLALSSLDFRAHGISPASEFPTGTGKLTFCFLVAPSTVGYQPAAAPTYAVESGYAQHQAPAQGQQWGTTY